MSKRHFIRKAQSFKEAPFDLLPLTFCWPELCQMVTSGKEAREGRSWIIQTSKIVSATQSQWEMTVIDFIENFIITA